MIPVAAHNFFEVDRRLFAQLGIVQVHAVMM
jgi:hypothetical protein